MRASFFLRTGILTAVALPFLLNACSDDTVAPVVSPIEEPDAGIQLHPGEECYPPDPSFVRLKFSPDVIALAPGQTRSVTITVSSDLCDPQSVTFTTDAAEAVEAPAPVTLDLRHPRMRVELTGGAAGSAKLRASLPLRDGTEALASLDIHVMDAALAPCSGNVSGKVAPGGTLTGSGGLNGASISLQAGADAPNTGAMYWRADAFDASLSCGGNVLPSGYTALGPAVTFGPATKKLLREIPFTIPVNPARMPAEARMRHLRVAYSSPSFVKPRLVPVTDPRIHQKDGVWVLSFLAPRLGTYQAVVEDDAGTRTFTRKITHRAVVGVSMGGGGAASFGVRRHDMFDVIAPLGGPSDWTYLLDTIHRHHLAGFTPNDGDNVPTEVEPMPEPMWPYEHPSTFNKWWYEFPADGNGGGFPRREYAQIFRDLALMYGNPNGQNNLPNGINLPAGVDPEGQSVLGEHTGRQCAVWVDPIDGHPDRDNQREVANHCPTERCAHPQVMQNYYDDEFNPKGTWPVITVCDGSPQNSTYSPWANTWSPDGNNFPIEVAVAVDYNGNGIRDENEPLIRAGQEPYRDLGPDGLASPQEPGYVLGVNEDPSGDDYDYQYNPGGTEGNARFDVGERFDDYGLDGVSGTSQSPYDVGEGDGKFTMADGLRTFLDRDPRTIFHGKSTNVPGGKLDDAALRRIDIWADGGTRDLFNFLVVANHFSGGPVSRGRPTAYYSDTTMLPGQIPMDQMHFVPGMMEWEDIPGVVVHRYGATDPTPKQVAGGAGQHVGTADEITRRLQASLYFVGSRWPEAPRWLATDSYLEPDPDAPYCETTGNCTFDFTDSRGRTGPVGISLPPGYAHKDQKNQRYPVIFLLHGYGQTPEDLEATIILVHNWMNNPGDSAATRLPKAILVYVDGRCRIGPSGEAECIRGTFFTESVRPTGAKIESWWVELTAHIDSNYRTLPPTEIEWTE